MSLRTNSDMVTAALRGVNARTTSGAMSTDHYRPEFTRWAAPYSGYLPDRLIRILNEAFRQGRISQVIYSYSTPIAWRDGDTWIIPEVTYSQTTSSKHQSQLYRLPGRKYIPGDAGHSEYAQILSGEAVYEYREGDRRRRYYGTGGE
jgi:hypothetical protein